MFTATPFRDRDGFAEYYGSRDDKKQYTQIDPVQVMHSDGRIIFYNDQEDLFCVFKDGPCLAFVGENSRRLELSNDVIYIPRRDTFLTSQELTAMFEELVKERRRCLEVESMLK